MSNQAHKNRLVRTGVDKAPKQSKTPAHQYRTITADYESASRKAHGKARRMQLDPNENPAGRVKYNVVPRVNFVTQEDRSTVTVKSDPAASSRGANVRANKERGTQSSSQRKVIK